MTTKKPARKRPSRAKAKPAAAVHNYYEITTGEVKRLPEDAFVTELNPSVQLPNFIVKLHDGTFTGAVEVKVEGDADLAVRKLSEHYLINEPFREFVNSIINGALAKQAESIKNQLSTMILKK